MSEWAELLFTYDDVEARIVQGILESENIHVIMDSLKISPYPVNIGRMGEIRLLVHSNELERARNILKAYESGNSKE